MNNTQAKKAKALEHLKHPDDFSGLIKIAKK